MYSDLTLDKSAEAIEGLGLDPHGFYEAAPFKGAAVTIVGAATEVHVEDTVVCDDEDCDHGLSEMCWTTVESIVFTGKAVVVMVGDDRKHEVDVEDLKALDEEQFCPGCGQVGCGHY